MSTEAITVEPHTRSRKVGGHRMYNPPGYRDEKTVTERHGFVARWPELGLEAWSMSKAAAVSMLAQMAKRKAAPSTSGGTN